MKTIVSKKNGKEIYGLKRLKWQNIESISDSESDEAQISGIKAAKQHSLRTTTGHGDNVDDHIRKVMRVKCSKEGELMYEAAIQGDWIAAEVLLGRDPNVAMDYVTEDGDRALHVAAAMKHKDFVEKLVERMSDFTLLDGRGYTACCYAALSGEVEIARVMIDKNPDLAAMHDLNKSTPLHKAALRGSEEMLSYLLKSTKSENLSKQEWFDLLLVTIRGRMYDMAVEIIGKDGSITTMFDEEAGTALHLLARQDIPNTPSSSSSSSLAAMVMDMLSDSLINMLFDMDDGNKPPEFGELPEKLLAEMQKWEKGSPLELIRKRHILHEATKAGNVKLMVVLICEYPQLIWDTDSNGYTFFHIAVIHRQSDVFNLIHQVEATIGLRTLLQDKKGNNILHLAAMPSAALNKTKLPPPLQMQNDLLWFKAVERIAPPSCAMIGNNQELKPRELFSMTHEGLLKESELRMMNMADSCLLIATILLTVLFTAAFTVPGGYGSQTGEPVLAKKHWFKVFLVFEVLGFIGSVISIIAFRTIMTSHFTENDFLSRLPLLQMLGLHSLVVSLVGAFSAFMSSISLFNLNMNGFVWFGFCALYLFGGFWIGSEISAVVRDMTLASSIRLSRHTLFLFNQDHAAAKKLTSNPKSRILRFFFT